jgi:hypothetical protein
MLFLREGTWPCGGHICGIHQDRPYECPELTGPHATVVPEPTDPWPATAAFAAAGHSTRLAPADGGLPGRRAAGGDDLCHDGPLAFRHGRPAGLPEGDPGVLLPVTALSRAAAAGRADRWLGGSLGRSATTALRIPWNEPLTGYFQE